MEETEGSGLPSYVIVIVMTLLAVLLLIVVTGVILLAIGAGTKPSPVTADSTEVIEPPTPDLLPTETPGLDVTAPIETTAEVTPESSPSAELTPDLEATPAA